MFAARSRRPVALAARAVRVPRFPPVPTQLLSTASPLASIKSIPARHPIIFGACFTSAKTCGADFFVQSYVEGKDLEDVDWRRTSTFATFGFFYMGIAQYFLYVKLMANRWFPNAGKYAAKSLKDKMADKQGTKELFYQVAIDQVIHIPWIFYPCYYLTKCAIMPRPAGHEDESLPSLAFHKWSTNFFADVKCSWQIWIPCNLINFGLMPMHFRVPFMAVCSFGFCLVLSITRGGEKPQLTDEAKKIVDETRGKLGDSATVADVVKAAIKHAGLKCSSDRLDLACFTTLMNDLGIENEALIKSRFLCCDRDSSGHISASEMTSLLMAFCCHESDDSLGYIFDTCDLDGNGYLEFHEFVTMLEGLLALRESLLVNGGDVMSEDTMDSYFSASGNKGPGPSQELDAPTRQRARLAELKHRYKRFRNKDNVSLEQILQYEAGKTAQRIMYEADVQVHDNRISKDEFEAWIKRKSKYAKTFLGLFEAFAPLMHS